MRLKEDSSSWKSSSIIKRDFKHISVDEYQTHKRIKKNTKKWCKGRIGIEHNYERKMVTVCGFIYKEMDVCKKCKKQEYIRHILRKTNLVQ